MFIISVAVAAVLHGAFFAMAPRVRLFQPLHSADAAMERFRIQIRDVAQPSAPIAGAQSGEEGRLPASRPGAVSDLYARGEETVQPDMDAGERPVEVPAIRRRVAADALPREHDLQADEHALRQADAKILEIAQETARRDIQVARRLVRPSPERLLDTDELPTLRMPRAEEPIPLVAEEGDTMLFRRWESGRAGGEAPAWGPGGAPPQPSALAQSLPLPEPPIAPERPIALEQQEARSESPYMFLDELVAMQMDVYQEAGEPGYFRLRIHPREDIALMPLAKDVTFVVDASGSITQSKLAVTARGLSRALDALHQEDRFNIVTFRDIAVPFQPDLVAATDDNKAAARQFLSELQARGETDIYKAILPVAQQRPRPGIPNIIVVVSDGRPTVGVRDTRLIINGLTQDNALRNSIFAFGGGPTVNRYMMDLIAYRNKGSAHVADKVSDIEKELPAFFEQFRDPILTNISADYGRIETKEVYPREIPDFFMGRAVTLYGRFAPEQDTEFVIRLSGAAGEQRKEVVFRADLRQAQKEGKEIAREWAFQKAYAIIGQISRDGELPALLEQLRVLKSEYGVSTSYDE